MRIGRVASLALPSILAGSLSMGTFGCTTPSSGTDLNPEGPPEILQVFVTERTPTSKALGLVYNGNLDYAVDESGGGADGSAPNQCGDIFDENGDDCTVANAVADPSQTFRIVLDELLEGTSVEEFVCACVGTDGVAQDGECPNNVVSTLDPAGCNDSPSTPNVNEGSRWLDVNADGMPDKARLVGGIATINCDGEDLYSTQPEDGFYNPSGNQLIPVATGLSGLGPALVISASAGLKTGADCTIRLSDTVKDKEGLAVVAVPPTAMAFHSESLALLSSVPTSGVSGVSPDLALNLGFNAFLKEDTIENVVLREKTGAVVISARELALGDDKISVKIDPTGTLRPDRDYEIVIPATTVTDIYAGKFPAEKLVTFKTGPFKLATSNPADKKTAVPLNQVIKLKFNVSLDPATINNIVLRVKAGGALVATTNAVDTADANGTSVTITPTAALTATTEYEIVVPVTLLGAQTDAFPAEKINTFTTGS